MPDNRDDLIEANKDATHLHLAVKQLVWRATAGKSPTTQQLLTILDLAKKLHHNVNALLDIAQQSEVERLKKLTAHQPAEKR
jgi:hypothetical protein